MTFSVSHDRYYVIIAVKFESSNLSILGDVMSQRDFEIGKWF